MNSVVPKRIVLDLDLCTGCGCIAIAIAKNFADAKVIASDISDAALAVAARNVQSHKLEEKITLLCGDLFEPIIRQIDSGAFDLIVSNPPYVSQPEFEKLEKNVKDYEPRLALDGGFDASPSIAVLAITRDPFIVYTSNIFAILGLRALFFALAGLFYIFRFLSTGVCIVLFFVGVKMLLIDIFPIPTGISLGGGGYPAAGLRGTVDNLSQERIGWNIAKSYHPRFLRISMTSQSAL
jgi:hypothetical protein